MHYYDIKSSSDIPADSDIVCLMQRNREKADGRGDLPDLDWTKGNVFQVQYQSCSRLF